MSRNLAYLGAIVRFSMRTTRMDPFASGSDQFERQESSRQMPCVAILHAREHLRCAQLTARGE